MRISAQFHYNSLKHIQFVARLIQIVIIGKSIVENCTAPNHFIRPPKHNCQYVKWNLCFFYVYNDLQLCNTYFHFLWPTNKTFDAIHSTEFPFSWQTPAMNAQQRNSGHESRSRKWANFQWQHDDSFLFRTFFFFTENRLTNNLLPLIDRRMFVHKPYNFSPSNKKDPCHFSLYLWLILSYFFP